MNFKKITFWLIVVLIIIFYSMMDESREAQITQTNKIEENTPSYKNRIKNFSSQILNKKNQTTHFIEASAYEIYKDQSNLLIKPKIFFYKESSEKLDYTVSAEKGRLLDNGDYLLTGSVYIRSSDNDIPSQDLEYNKKTSKMTQIVNAENSQFKGAFIRSKSLIINNSDGNEILRTDELIDYKSRISKINSNGMIYDSKSKKLKLFNGVEGEYK